ncbi:MAG: hypothetical protein WCK53_07505 [Methanomicrobiales archaeon]
MGEADAESRIANSRTDLQADILKVGRHGSATSSSSTFLTNAQPKTSVIEVGAGNSYGHPTSATLGHLAQVGSAMHRTDLNGDVTVTTDGTKYRNVRYQNCSGIASTHIAKGCN